MDRRGGRKALAPPPPANLKEREGREGERQRKKREKRKVGEIRCDFPRQQGVDLGKGGGGGGLGKHSPYKLRYW